MRAHSKHAGNASNSIVASDCRQRSTCTPEPRQRYSSRVDINIWHEITASITGPRSVQRSRTRCKYLELPPSCQHHRHTTRQQGVCSSLRPSTMQNPDFHALCQRYLSSSLHHQYSVRSALSAPRTFREVWMPIQGYRAALVSWLVEKNVPHKSPR